jgi:methyltransferase (TIGR00027 family)
VPVDFERDRLAEVLTDAGLDRGAPSFWIWEGVTEYLTQPAMTATLEAIAANAAPGSRVAVTYAEPDVFRHPALDAAARLAARAVGEPLRGTIGRGDLARLAARSGLEALSDEGDDAWRARYAAGTARIGPSWERLLVLERR